MQDWQLLVLKRKASLQRPPIRGHQIIRKPSSKSRIEQFLPTVSQPFVNFLLFQYSIRNYLVNFFVKKIWKLFSNLSFWHLAYGSFLKQSNTFQLTSILCWNTVGCKSFQSFYILGMMENFCTLLYEVRWTLADRDIRNVSYLFHSIRFKSSCLIFYSHSIW